MDLMDFEGQDLYFDEALPDEVRALIAEASANYAEGTAEAPLLKAIALAPDSLTVLVALYRFYYYQHRLPDTYHIAERAIEVSGQRLGFPADWQDLAAEHIAQGALQSMVLVRFYLWSLKGAAWLKLRMHDIDGAKPILDKLASLDTANRLGIKDLLDLLEDMARDAEEEAA